MNSTRRQFLKASAVAAAAWQLPLYAAAKPRYPIGFSTLGCPAWEWIQILDFAEQHQFAAVELRGLMGTMDLPSRPEFSPERIAQSKKDVASRGLRLACVSSSAQMHQVDPEKRKAQMADARRFIDLAAALGVPYVRVFGNDIVGPRDEAIVRVAGGLRELGEYSGPKNVTVLIESHGDFTDSPTLRAVLEQADSPHVALLWDAHHTFVSGKEDPAYTYSQVGKFIRHTHLKDSLRDDKGVHYVLTGKGDVPVKKQVEVLVQNGYRGYFSFEWEKVWHPEIAAPEVAIADFAQAAAQYLRSAGFAPGKAARSGA